MSGNLVDELFNGDYVEAMKWIVSLKEVHDEQRKEFDRFLSFPIRRDEILIFELLRTTGYIYFDETRTETLNGKVVSPRDVFQAIEEENSRIAKEQNNRRNEKRAKQIELLFERDMSKQERHEKLKEIVAHAWLDW